MIDVFHTALTAPGTQHRIEPMTDATRNALLALGAALAADPAAQKELALWGDMPTHLADLIDELELEGDDE